MGVEGAKQKFQNAGQFTTRKSEASCDADVYFVFILKGFEQSNTIRGRFCIPCRDDWDPDPEYTLYGSISPHTVSVSPSPVQDGSFAINYSLCCSCLV